MTKLTKTLQAALAITVVAGLATVAVSNADAGPKKAGGFLDVSSMDLGSGR